MRQAGPVYEIRDGQRINITDEEISKAEDRLAKAEATIRKYQRHDA